MYEVSNSVQIKPLSLKIKIINKKKGWYILKKKKKRKRKQQQK